MEHVTLSPARIRKNKYVARKLNHLLDIMHELKGSLEMVAEATGDIRSGPSWPGQVGSRPSVTGAPGVVSGPLGDQR